MKKRIPYILGFLLLTAVEVFIALFVHDRIIRPYIGDVIVVWVVYCFVQIFLGGRLNSYAVAAGVLVFAFIVEFLQLIHIVDILGLGDSAFFRTLIGTGFTVIDLFCYAAGTLVTFLGIWIYGTLSKRRKE